MRRWAVPCVACAHSVSTARLARSCRSVTSSGTPAASRPSSCTTTSASARSPSWRSSTGVNLTCCGPRRISTCTSRTPPARSASSTVSGTSVRDQLVRGAGQHAGDVQRDVAGADHRDIRDVQPRRDAVLGMTAVPADHRPRADASGQVLARDAETSVESGAGGVHDRGVVLAQHRQRHRVGARADGHAAEKAHLTGAERPGEHADDRLHLHVVRRDAVAHQSVRGGQAVQDVDVDGGVGGGERGRRVEAGGP